MKFDGLLEALLAASENIEKTRATWLATVKTQVPAESIEVAEAILRDPNLTSSDVDVSHLVALGFVIENPDGSLAATLPGW